MANTENYIHRLNYPSAINFRRLRQWAIPLHLLFHGLGLLLVLHEFDRRKSADAIWRNLAGYKFDVACPTFAFALSRTNCTETGKNREDAHAKCQSRHVLYQVGDANR